jgi:AmmeMemoRadiSam system protein B
VREPAVAGLFYPDDPKLLRRTVTGLLDAVTVPDGDRLAAAYVVPHAGYRYSGSTAAHVYARLRAHSAEIARIVILGPAHRVPLDGAAVPVTDRWRTPLGEVPIDTAGAKRLVKLGLATATDVPHEPEHSLEVQLPFLQLAGARPDVLPVCVGRLPAPEVGALVKAVTGPGVVVLCSTDLSHYLTEPQAVERDAATLRSVVELTPERLEVRDACGFFALRGVLSWAKAAECAVTVMHRCTSADTGGTPDRVVGYCAAAVHCHAA